MTSEMKKLTNPQYQVTVKTRQLDGDRFGTAVGLGGSTQGEALKKAFAHAAFYLRKDDGYESVRVEVNEACADCGGSGFFHLTPRKSTKCKTCKGVNPTREPHIVFDLTRDDLREMKLEVVNA